MPFAPKVAHLPYDPPDSIPIFDFIFNDKYRARSQAASESPFTCGLSGKTYSIEEVKERVDLLARALSERLGWEPNDGTEWDKVLGIFSLNSIDYLPISYAVHRLSGVASVASAAYTTSELVHQFKSSRVKAVFTCIPLLKIALEAAEICNIPKKNVFIIELPKEATGGPLAIPTGFLTVDDLIQNGKKLPELQNLKWSKGQGARQTAFLCYSSGTSGLPKGVMCSHYNMISNILQSHTHQPHRHTRSPHPVLGLLPQSHIYSLLFICQYELLYGNTIILLPSFTLPTFLTAIQTHRIKILPLVPPIIVAMLNNFEVVKKFDLECVSEVWSAAAPLAKETVDKFLSQHPTWIVQQGYGMTESCVAVTITLPDDLWAGSCGMLMPGVEAKLMDPEGKEVTTYDTPGELVLKSPSVVLGYFNNEKANQETFRDGWLWTGDEGVFRKSEKGNEHLFIVDRIKELIKVKGSQVAPAELEAHLLTHPHIADSAVIPIPDDYAGEVPKAFVVLTPSASSLPKAEIAKDIIKFVEQAKARHKWLKGGVEFIDVVPKSPSGKILRRLLRDKERAKREGVKAKL